MGIRRPVAVSHSRSARGATPTLRTAADVVNPAVPPPALPIWQHEQVEQIVDVQDVADLLALPPKPMYRSGCSKQ